MAIFKNIYINLWRKIIFYCWQFKFIRDWRYKILQKIYANIDGFSLSKIARKDHDFVEYAYGEINFEAFYALLTLCKIDENTVFCDLGCGVGKPTLLIAVFFQLKMAIGVEKFPELFRAAKLAKQSIVTASNNQYLETKIKFYNADLLEFDVSECNLILINIIGFIDSDWQKLQRNLARLTQDSCVITIAKPLADKNFVVIKECTMPMSWGITKAYLNRRL